MNQEAYTEALSHLDAKLKIDEARPALRGNCVRSNESRQLSLAFGRYEEARAALDAAFEIANRPDFQLKAVLAWVHANRAGMALSQRSFADAKREAQLALDISQSKWPDDATCKESWPGRGLLRLGRDRTKAL